MHAYPVSPRLSVPSSIQRPPYVGKGDVPENYTGSHVQLSLIHISEPTRPY